MIPLRRPRYQSIVVLRVVELKLKAILLHRQCLLFSSICWGSVATRRQVGSSKQLRSFVLRLFFTFVTSCLTPLDPACGTPPGRASQLAEVPALQTRGCRESAHTAHLLLQSMHDFIHPLYYTLLLDSRRKAEIAAISKKGLKRQL